MKFTKFKIKNFKGINELEIDFSKQPNGKIFPLVGLNESGKTTILEAIAWFQEVIARFQHVSTDEEAIKKLRHKSRLADFNEKISIEATVQLENEDKKLIKEFLNEEKLECQDMIHEISITTGYDFSKGIKNRAFINWGVALYVRRQKQRVFKHLSEYGIDNTTWRKLVHKLKNSIPKILYFENFLFDFPDKIYLEEIENDKGETSNPTQNEYRKVLQDILNSFSGEKYFVKDHILDRIKSRSDDEALNQILNEMSKKLNDEIIKNWQEVYKESSKKEVIINCNSDERRHYLEFKIKENNSGFSINERSLGFKWFFGFLIFTEFRKARKDEKGEYLFLFDEPANNLHQRHQQKLLDLFEKLTDKAKIIYSTHSHYLLNSKYLLTSYVVKDAGIIENSENNPQDIKAELYKKFVAKYPKEQDHFKPLLDVLEYVHSPFEKTSNIVFFEGKYDYYTFKLILNTQFKNKYKLNLYPGSGVNSYEKIFREYLANNKKFIAIFDGDSAGKKAKRKHIKDISVELEDNIFTLCEISNDFEGYTTEELFSDEDKKKILSDDPQSPPYKGGKLNKTSKEKFNSEILNLFSSADSPGKDKISISEQTKDNFKEIFDFIKNKMQKK